MGILLVETIESWNNSLLSYLIHRFSIQLYDPSLFLTHEKVPPRLILGHVNHSFDENRWEQLQDQDQDRDQDVCLNLLAEWDTYDGRLSLALSLV